MRDQLVVGLIGNMNNNHFALGRYLIDEGYKVVLFIFNNEPQHFHPQNDVLYEPKIEIKILDWRLETLSEVPISEIHRSVKEVDVLIGEGISPAFLNKANIRLHLFTPFGGDLYLLPFYKHRLTFRTLLGRVKRLVFKRKFLFPKELFTRKQLKGIQDADLIISHNNEWASTIEKIGATDKWKKIPVPLVYTPEYTSKRLSDYFSKHESNVASSLSALTSNFDFLFLNHSRQYWRDHGKGVIDEHSNKGNDRLIRGFAHYLKESNKSSCLILLEYGPDVEASKTLVEELRIENNIFWFPKLSRRDIMLIISRCNLVCNEFVNSWISGGVIFEALSMGKPLMGYRDDAKYAQLKSDYVLYPMINVRTEKEIANAFLDFERNELYYYEMGRKCSHWYQEQIVDRSIRFFTEYLDSQVKRKISRSE